MKKHKVLIFADRLRVGGIQMLLVNLLKYFDQSELVYELLLLDDGKTYELEMEIAKSGITIHKLDGIWLRKPQDYWKYWRAVDAFFRKYHDYSAIHIHTGPKNYFLLKYAKKYGIKTRIAHAHNTGYQTKSKAQMLLGDYFKWGLRKYATHYVACSQLAGTWMFGKKAEIMVIPNGVELNKFCFQEKIRLKIRKELAVEANFVVGNVGRFTTQKNHLFLLEVFAKLLEKNPRAVLVLVGIGETLEMIQQKALDLNIASHVKFLGFRTDVSDIMQGMDLFLMPSLYEGFPVTAVEAQCTGLPCVFSDTITKETKLLNQSTYLSLDDNLDEWVRKIELLGSYTLETRLGIQQELKEKGFDIQDMAMRLEKIYQQR